MYYIHGSVWAIPTYRVYRLYDIVDSTALRVLDICNSYITGARDVWHLLHHSCIAYM